MNTIRIWTGTTKRKTSGLNYTVYRANNAEFLRFELEAAAEIVAKALVQDLGFKIKEGISDVREIVVERVAKALEEYDGLYQPPYQGNVNGIKAYRIRGRISPRNLDGMIK